MGKPSWNFRPEDWLEKLVADYMTAKGITKLTEGIHGAIQELAKQVEIAKSAPANALAPQPDALEKRAKAAEADRDVWKSYAEDLERKTGMHIDKPKASQPAAPAQSTPPPTAKPATPDHVTKQSAIFQPPLKCCYYGMEIAAATCELIQKKANERCKSVDCKIYRDAHPNEPAPQPKEFNPCASDSEDESEEIVKEALDENEPSVTDISDAAAPPSTNITTPNEKPMCRWIAGTVVSIEYCVNTQTYHSERCNNAKCPIYLGDANATRIEGLGVHPA
jgi:hypothetical protein